MNIVVVCNACSVNVSIDAKHAGRVIACPKCGKPVRVPAQPASTSSANAPSGAAESGGKTGDLQGLPEAVTVEDASAATPLRPHRPILRHTDLRTMVRILEVTTWFALTAALFAAAVVAIKVDKILALYIVGGSVLAAIPYFILYRTIELIAEIEINTRHTSNALLDIQEHLDGSQ